MEIPWRSLRVHLQKILAKSCAHGSGVPQPQHDAFPCADMPGSLATTHVIEELLLSGPHSCQLLQRVWHNGTLSFRTLRLASLVSPDVLLQTFPAAHVCSLLVPCQRASLKCTFLLHAGTPLGMARALRCCIPGCSELLLGEEELDGTSHSVATPSMPRQNCGDLHRGLSSGNPTTQYIDARR